MSEFGDWLTDELRARSWSHNELSRRSGMSQAAVSAVIAGDRNPGCEFCVKVATAFEISPVLVLTKAGIIPLQPDSDPRLEEIIELIRQLSPEMQKDILDYVRFRYRQEKG